jgi:hypothetical protein
MAIEGSLTNKNVTHMTRESTIKKKRFNLGFQLRDKTERAKINSAISLKIEATYFKTSQY